MRIGVLEALGYGLQAVFGTFTTAGHAIAEVHDEAPVLAGLLGIGDFF